MLQQYEFAEVRLCGSRPSLQKYDCCSSMSLQNYDCATAEQDCRTTAVLQQYEIAKLRLLQQSYDCYNPPHKGLKDRHRHRTVTAHPVLC